MMVEFNKNNMDLPVPNHSDLSIAVIIIFVIIIKNWGALFTTPAPQIVTQ